MKRTTWLCVGVLAWSAWSASAAGDSGFNTLDPERTVIVTIPQGRFIIELNQSFAPRTSAQFKRLVKDGFYNGLDFYRVIDGFVAQGGDGSDMSETENAVAALLPEFERAWTDDLAWTPVQVDDPFAPITGFVDGFAAARDPKRGRIWLTHCPGAVAMARGNQPGTGSTDFYIVIGQSPRYLDRNLTIFGRVVFGMDVVQTIRRGPRDQDGMIDEKSDRTRIMDMTLVADQPPERRERLQRIDTASPAFKTTLEARRHRTHEFFHHKPPAVLDICQQPLATRIGSGETP